MSLSKVSAFETVEHRDIELVEDDEAELNRWLNENLRLATVPVWPSFTPRLTDPSPSVVRIYDPDTIPQEILRRLR